MHALPLSLSTLQLVDGQEEDEKDIHGDDAATWMGQPSPTICLNFFSPEAIEEGRRKKGEMYGTRMLVVCGRLSSLCWRFVVLNRGTRERGLRTWAAALDSRRNSSHSGASEEPQNERKLAIRIA